MEPAQSIITKFGGVDAVARITGCHVSRVYRWTYPRSRGGTDGIIPHAHAATLLKYAETEGIDFDAAEFFRRGGSMKTPPFPPAQHTGRGSSVDGNGEGVLP